MIGYTQVVSDIQRLRRELLGLQKLIDMGYVKE